VATALVSSHVSKENFLWSGIWLRGRHQALLSRITDSTPRARRR
jgi:hypothetical protein